MSKCFKKKIVTELKKKKKHTTKKPTNFGAPLGVSVHSTKNIASLVQKSMGFVQTQRMFKLY